MTIEPAAENTHKRNRTLTKSSALPIEGKDCPSSLRDKENELLKTRFHHAKSITSDSQVQINKDFPTSIDFKTETKPVFHNDYLNTSQNFDMESFNISVQPKPARPSRKMDYKRQNPLVRYQN